MMEQKAVTQSKGHAHSDFVIVLTLFVTARVMLAFLFNPYSFFTSGFLGHTYYYEMAAYSARGQFPYVHFWFEYPPVFPYLAIAIYQWTNLLGAGFEYFNRALAFAKLPFECLTLINLYRIARWAFYDAAAVRVSWVYALLIIPAYYWWHSPDPILVALTLQSLYWFTQGKPYASAIALGLAVATKFTPVFLLATVWRFARDRRIAIISTLLTVGLVAGIFAPFLILSPTFTLASLQSLIAVSSWETIWALLDGNLGYGNVGAWADHFDAARAGVPIYNPVTVPLWLTLGLVGLLFIFVYTRKWNLSQPRHWLAFSGIMLMLFLLWSKGWSPQWATLVIPFFLLLYPDLRGMLLALVLSAVGLLDWPMTLNLDNPAIYALGVLLRTGIFAGVAIALYRECVPARVR